MPLLPIVERELRIASRKAWTHWLRFAAGLVVMLLFGIFTGANRRNASVTAGHDTFLGMTMLMLGLCMLSGLFLTADILSEEKREGTLGLLFLTPLKSYDIVLGKLASSSIQGIFGIVSVIPVLALPLMMGGVTHGEFLRVVLVLLITLFFSLGLGLLASSISTEARQALITTLALLLIFAALLPLLWQIGALFNPALRPNALLWTSPVFALAKALDPRFQMPGARHDFICSVLALSGLALIAGSLSCWRIQVAVRAGSEGGTKSVEVPKVVRLPAVLGNPIYWLTESQFAGTKWWKRLLWAGFPLWVIFLVAACLTRVGGFPTAFVISLALLYGLHQLLKLITAVETTRRFSEDRRNGALELLLVSPLKLNELIDGHVRGIWAQLRRPIITLALMNLLLMTVVIAFPKAFDVENDRPAFCGMILVAILLLVLDLRALIWVGMWRAAVAKRHHRAVLMALLLVMSLPWFLAFLGFSGVLDALPHLSFVVVTGSWTIVSLAIDLIATRKAREWMKHRFRDAVTSGS